MERPAPDIAILGMLIIVVPTFALLQTFRSREAFDRTLAEIHKREDD